MWEPICEGERAARVWSALAEIEDALARRTTPAADLAVFWTYLSTVREDDATAARTQAALARFVAEIERGYARPALFDGLAGAGWAAAHVASDAQELLEAVDAKLLGVLEHWTGEYDLVSGLAGFGVYFLERDSTLGLERVVAQLAATAQRVPDGVTWHTRADLLAAIDRERWPEGAYDCGVAHGVAGVAGVLARIATRPGAPARAAVLAVEATRWLLAQREGGAFPALVDGARRDPARTGWCYGAPGIALALASSRRDELADWLALPADAIAVDGDSVCHGAACLLHLANRMYQATGRPEHRATALAWLDRVLAARRPGDGAGGYGYGAQGAHRAAILSGSAGVGLALLAAVSALEPAWDRMMLCDLPTR